MTMIDVLDRELERLHSLIRDETASINSEERSLLLLMVKELHLAFQTHVVIGEEKVRSFGGVQSEYTNDKELPF